MGRHLSFDPDRAIELYKKGNTHQDIADLLKVDRSNISRFFQSRQIYKTQAQLDYYKAKTVDKLYEREFNSGKLIDKVVKHFNDNDEVFARLDDQKKINLMLAANTTNGTASDKRRLEQNLPNKITANYLEVKGEISVLDAEEKRLKGMLKAN